MVKFTRLSIFLFFTSLKAFALQTDNEVNYVYSSVTGESIHITRTEKLNLYQILEGHVAYPTEIYRSDEFVFVMDSNFFGFALPENIYVGKSWSSGLSTYLVLKKKDVRFLGVGVNAYVIEIKPREGDLRTWVIYSREKGIIAFSRLVAEEVFIPQQGRSLGGIIEITYWLSSEKGLGSQTARTRAPINQGDSGPA